MMHGLMADLNELRTAASYWSGLVGRVGIRLDPGNLTRAATDAKASLDAAGLRQARIVASGGLDEYRSWPPAQ